MKKFDVFIILLLLGMFLILSAGINECLKDSACSDLLFLRYLGYF